MGGLTLAAGESRTSVLELGGMGRIRGRVRDAAGRAVPGAVVLVAGAGVDGVDARASVVRVEAEEGAEVSLHLGADRPPRPIRILPSLPNR